MSNERKEIDKIENQVKEDRDTQVICVRINRKKIIAMIFCVKTNPQPNDDWIKDNIKSTM